MLRSGWATGDYVAVEILDPGSGQIKIELPNGRMSEPMKGDLVIGALGTRFATLEATGSWQNIESDGQMHLLTGAGLLGKMTSKSVFIPNIIEAIYVGHVFRGGKPVQMMDFVPNVPKRKFTKPVVLLVGTSMSAGKTTSARIITNILEQSNYKVVGAKISGAGRFKDILALKDVGADAVVDFVDAGLPSTICPRKVFLSKMDYIKNYISMLNPDFAVIEVGASPLEPYNGDLAIESIRKQLKCVVLGASDPYAVYGIIKAFQLKPDIVTGIATNTKAGRNLVENLCDVRALNIIDPKNTGELKRILERKLDISLISKRIEHQKR